MASPEPAPSPEDAVYRMLRAAGATGWRTAAGNAALLDRLSPVLPRPGRRGPRVLDLGCGAGQLAIDLAWRGYQVIGIDHSNAAIEWAVARAIGVDVTFRVDDARRLATCDDAVFDFAIDADCLGRMSGAGRADALDAVCRVLAPGGVLALVTTGADTPSRPMSLLSALGGFGDAGDKEEEGASTVAAAETLLGDLRTAGFEIDSVQVDAPRSRAGSDDLLILARRPAS